MSARAKLAVVFGGPTDYERSCASAAAVVAHLDRRRFAVTPIRVTPHGSWVIGRELPAGQAPDVDGLLHATRDELSWSGLSAVDNLAAGISAVSTCHVVFPLIHGPHGDGGTLPALLGMVGLPYVGNGVLPGAAGTDRDHTRRLLTGAGLAVADDPVTAGRRIVTAVLQYPDGRLVAGPPLASGPDGIAQAELDPAVVATVRALAIQAFRALGCTGLLQVDFVLSPGPAGVAPAVGAVDVLPELTTLSRFPSVWRAAGIGYSELLTTLVETGLATVRSSHAARVGLPGAVHAPDELHP